MFIHMISYIYMYTYVLVYVPTLEQSVYSDWLVDGCGSISYVYIYICIYNYIIYIYMLHYVVLRWMYNDAHPFCSLSLDIQQITEAEPLSYPPGHPRTLL